MKRELEERYRDNPYVEVYEDEILARSDRYFFSIIEEKSELVGYAILRDGEYRTVAKLKMGERSIDELLSELRAKVDAQDRCREVLEKMAGTKAALGGRIDHGYAIVWSGESLSLQVDPETRVWTAKFGGSAMEAESPEVAVAGAKSRHLTYNKEDRNAAYDGSRPGAKSEK